jgi:hypothetical protein
MESLERPASNKSKCGKGYNAFRKLFDGQPRREVYIDTAANVGRHPVHLYKAYFTQRTATEALILTGPRNFGTEILNPGLKRDFPAIQSKLDLSNLKEAYVVDAIERKFKCKIPRSW